VAGDVRFGGIDSAGLLRGAAKPSGAWFKGRVYRRTSKLEAGHVDGAIRRVVVGSVSHTGPARVGGGRFQDRPGTTT
jgi:hypothetical protein